MQEQMQQMKETMKNTRFVGVSASSLVKVTLNGEKELVNIEISPETLSDADALQDLIISAHRDAAKKIDQEQPENNIPFF